MELSSACDEAALASRFRPALTTTTGGARIGKPHGASESNHWCQIFVQPVELRSPQTSPASSSACVETHARPCGRCCAHRRSEPCGRPTCRPPTAGRYPASSCVNPISSAPVRRDAVLREPFPQDLLEPPLRDQRSPVVRRVGVGQRPCDRCRRSPDRPGTSHARSVPPAAMIRRRRRVRENLEGAGWALGSRTAGKAMSSR